MLIIYHPEVVNNRTVYIEDRFDLKTLPYTPVVVEDDNLIIITNEGTVSFDKESILVVTPEVLKRNGIDKLDVEVTGTGSDSLCDKNGVSLFDLNGYQLRIKGLAA